MKCENMNWHFEPKGVDGIASGPCVINAPFALYEAWPVIHECYIEIGERGKREWMAI